MFALQAAASGTAQTASNNTVAQTYSDAAVVPAVTSVALLSNYLTVDASNSSERARVMVLMLVHSACPAMLCTAFCSKKNAQHLYVQCMLMHLRHNSVDVTQVTAVMPC